MRGSKGGGVDPDRTVIERRVRNRMITWFAVAAEGGSRVLEWGFSDVINDWADLGTDPPETRHYPEAVYSPEEIRALAAVDRAYEKFLASPANQLADTQAMATLEWQELQRAARHTEEVFRVRGGLEDDGTPQR
jgi:hypothetical protein